MAFGVGCSVTDFDYEIIKQPEPSWQVKLLKLMHRLERHKERYLRAWMCATGVVDPRDVEIVTRLNMDGSVMYMRRKSERVVCPNCGADVR